MNIKYDDIETNGKPVLRPKIELIGHPWSAPDGLGFTVGRLDSLNDSTVIAASKLKGAYSWLEMDPYDETRSRLRGFATGTLFSTNDGVNLVFSDSLIHQQRENVEHPGIARRLPPIPYGTSFHPEIEALVLAAWDCCVPAGFESHYGFQWKTHLLRLQPTKSQAAHATPNEPHKDDSHWVFVVVMDRQNIKGGRNTLFNNRKQALVSFTLDSWQYFSVDDRKFFHHVETVSIVNGEMPGYRDVLVIEISTLAPAL